jgi:diaminopimelate decarboxylase
MDHFEYQHGHLYAEDVSIQEIADNVGTPFYCYSSATLLRHYRVFVESFEPRKVQVFFAVKANSNLAVLATLGQQGAGADCVSEGEIRRALHASIPANRIVFSGVGKQKHEMEYALKAGIYQFNVESEPELYALNEVAMHLGLKAPIAFRVNPDVDGQTHHKITTGRKDNKFGIAFERVESLYEIASGLAGIQICGLTTHIGSQITTLAPFEMAFSKVIDLVRYLKNKSYPIERLDLGGGLGIPYEGPDSEGGAHPPAPKEYASLINRLTSDLDCQLMLEPGRLIAGNAGILVTRIIYIKPTDHRRFVIIDAAMNDLIRPSFYEAYHAIIPVYQDDNDQRLAAPVDVVGPVCETSDIFAVNRFLPPCKEGDLLAVRSAGAYGAVMSSSYNTRLLIPEILVHGDQWSEVRPRPSYESLFASEQIPSWIKLSE